MCVQVNEVASRLQTFYAAQDSTEFRPDDTDTGENDKIRQFDMCRVTEIELCAFLPRGPNLQVTILYAEDVRERPREFSEADVTVCVLNVSGHRNHYR